jgi:cysteinyl-tRNA synthetase
MELVLQRQAAKEEKNFALADELRKKIDELWYVIIDNRGGATVERKK